MAILFAWVVCIGIGKSYASAPELDIGHLVEIAPVGFATRVGFLTKVFEGLRRLCVSSLIWIPPMKRKEGGGKQFA
ncbi:hypothetical protein BSZ19_09435 [Bradyrhizobium japonicum]|uniref:Uncharacterized protein n=1 Tax=Bradyrhizobium japonicum TaxID=375 RepID=A0A1Y2JTU5_BRAJP|nr:hypothetical protein [Bradyrhizobium japonicum]OSJ35221.1 hypothetical protein BSZ19_09435 [Bradyrhizobium japonicum]